MLSSPTPSRAARPLRSTGAEIAQLVEHATENRGVASSILALGTTNAVVRTRAEVAQLVEHHLAKVRVAGSSPVFRSERFFQSKRWTSATTRPGDEMSLIVASSTKFRRA